MIFLLFYGEKNLWMGKVETARGKYQAHELTARGEHMIGDSMRVLQRGGVPEYRDKAEKLSDGGYRMLTLEKVTPSLSQDFEEAFQRYARAQGWTLLVLPESLEASWEKMRAWPLTDKERFDTFFALAERPETWRKWNSTFARADKALLSYV